ncbi:hypothetical protein B0T21DRAFT_409073 [Apiosordaria backusii]|uniref:Uncharacterized protein n=1 Tax=Apiosordaria backusii TaxID=314023 RepID=A0AA40EMU7_9PEZI|nr:hypothetical protein B0T21DRAFT_409073 [Apiosordaria backusii]
MSATYLKRRTDNCVPEALRRLEIEPRDAFIFLRGVQYVRERLNLAGTGTTFVTGRGSKGWDVETLPRVRIGPHIATAISWPANLNGRLLDSFRPPLRLLSVISVFRNLDASDPRDKVFAFLNIAKEGVGIVPNYRATVQDVFRQTAEAIMRSTNELSILSHIEDLSDRKIEGLPGWVPDFSAKLETAPFDNGGDECRFRASYVHVKNATGEIILNPDGSLSVVGYCIDTVHTVTDLPGDLISILTLALKGPARYPGYPNAWLMQNLTSFKVGDSYKMMPSRASTRIEALWWTLITNNEYDVEELNSGYELAAGFANWLLRDILQVRSLLQDFGPDHWIGEQATVSLYRKVAFWSALCEGRQLDELQESEFLDWPMTLGYLKKVGKREQLLVKIMEDQAVGGEQHEDQEALQESKDAGKVKGEVLDESEHLEGPESVEHLSTLEYSANKILEFLEQQGPLQQGEDEDDWISEKYKRNANRCFSQLQRAQIRNFEKLMKEATRGRKLFFTDGGRFGLGPMSTRGADEDKRRDQIWLREGAKVPFILRETETSGRYKIVGEAYVHRVMYGELIGELIGPPRRISLV